MYVCYATSNEYCGYTGISMLSLLKNGNSDLIKKIFILDYGIKEDNRKRLDGIGSSYGIEIEYIQSKELLEARQKELGITAFRDSLATYSRAFIDYIIPDYVDELLYIDSDTVVCGSISDLKEIDMSDKVIAGVVCLELYDKQHSVEEFPLLSGNKMYIGCGIVLYNLANWRKFQCRDYVRTVCEQMKSARFADQTIINNAIPERLIQKLPPKYNYFGHTGSVCSEQVTMRAGNWYNKREIEEATKNPVIIHYKGGPLVRPWYEGCVSRRTKEFLDYKAMSPWFDDELIPIEHIFAGMKRTEQIQYKYGKRMSRQKYMMVERAIRFLMRIEIKVYEMLGGNNE